jgi:hypothetical protein
MDQTSAFCKAQEMLDGTSISKHVQAMLGQTSLASQAQKLYEQYLPKNTFSSLGLEALQRTEGLDQILAKEYEKYLAPVSAHQGWLEKMQRQALGGLSIQDLAKQIEQSNPAFAAMEAAKKQMDAMFGSFRGTDFSAFEEAGQDEQAEAERTAQSISRAATAEPTLQRAVAQILAAIEAQKKPAVQAMLLLFFMKVLDWLLAGAISTVMGHFSPLVLGESPQAATKGVKEVARQVVQVPELLADYRYVSSKVLIVRQNPRALSPEVARLTFGKPVKLVKKEKDFALVVWSDKDAGAEIQGWVFARYLGKFN